MIFAKQLQQNSAELEPVFCQRSRVSPLFVEKIQEKLQITDPNNFILTLNLLNGSLIIIMKLKNVEK